MNKGHVYFFSICLEMVGLILFYIIILLILLSSCASMTGSFVIDEGERTTRSIGSGEIVRFPDGKSIPDGYKYLTVKEFNSNALTVKCSYEFMIQEAERVTGECGGDAYRLSDVKKPNHFTTSCYSCNLLILIKSNSDKTDDFN